MGHLLHSHSTSHITHTLQNLQLFPHIPNLAMASTKLIATIFILSLIFHTTTLTLACGTCKPKPKPSQKCPTDTLKLGVCADVLGLVNVVLGSPASSKCCSLLQGLVDLEAALCLCTAIKANVLGINLNVPVTLSLLLSACQKSLPPGFQC